MERERKRETVNERETERGRRERETCCLEDTKEMERGNKKGC